MAGMLPASLFVLDVSEAEILREFSYLKRFVTRYRSFGCESEESREDALTIPCKH